MKLVREPFCWALDLEKHGMNLMYITKVRPYRDYIDEYRVNISPRSLIKFIILTNDDVFGMNYLRSIVEKKDK